MSLQPLKRRRAPRGSGDQLRDEILDATTELLMETGHAKAVSIRSVAQRVGVTPPSIYLHFADKETLFQELIRMELSPVVAALENVSHADIPFRAVTGQLIEVFVREIFETRRKDVIRLVITEGPRFPKLAEFYYREVISRVMETIRAMLRRAHERGELTTDALVRFPQLLAAPGIVAIIWSGLFDRFEPLDVRALMRAHFDVLLGSGGAA